MEAWVPLPKAPYPLACLVGKPPSRESPTQRCGTWKEQLLSGGGHAGGVWAEDHGGKGGPDTDGWDEAEGLKHKRMEDREGEWWGGVSSGPSAS